MAIGVQGEANRSMSQGFTDYLGIGPGHQHEAGEGVPQIVEAALQPYAVGAISRKDLASVSGATALKNFRLFRRVPDRK